MKKYLAYPPEFFRSAPYNKLAAGGRFTMTALQFFNAFRTFGADILLLALGVTLFTSLLKKTVMKNCNKKAFVFLPFAI